jgi:hypothetical protein
MSRATLKHPPILVLVFHLLVSDERLGKLTSYRDLPGILQSNALEKTHAATMHRVHVPTDARFQPEMHEVTLELVSVGFSLHDLISAMSC